VKTPDHFRTLLDRGANGGVSGDDTRIIEITDRSCNILGVAKHTIDHLPLVTAGGVTRTQMGDVIIILNQMASMPGQKTILSALQLEYFKCSIVDKAPGVNGGKVPHMTTPEGYRMPLRIRNGLPYMELRPFTDHEWADLPHVHLTSDGEWDPRVFDTVIDEKWFEQQPQVDTRESIFDEHGNYKNNEEDDTSRRQGGTLTRETMRVNLTEMIRDEIDDDFLFFEMDGEMRDYYCPDDLREVFPVTRSQTGPRAKLKKAHSKRKQDSPK
jgi:hypothetical protein